MQILGTSTVGYGKEDKCQYQQAHQPRIVGRCRVTHFAVYSLSCFACEAVEWGNVLVRVGIKEFYYGYILDTVYGIG